MSPNQSARFNICIGNLSRRQLRKLVKILMTDTPQCSFALMSEGELYLTENSYRQIKDFITP